MNMDFRNINRVNTLINLVSGNLLPLTVDARFSRSWQMYYVIVMLIEVLFLIALILGLSLVPAGKAFKDGMVCVSTTLQTLFMLTQLYMRKDLTTQLIYEINNFLQSADETMKEIVHSTLKQKMMLFAIYGMVSLLTIFLWMAMPMKLISERSRFYYVDYSVPAAFTPEPFSASVMIMSNIFLIIATMYLCLKRFGANIYMMHLVLLLTSRYRYIATKLMMFFQTVQSNHDDTTLHLFGTDQSARKELREICRHHNKVMRLSFMLKKLLSASFTILYLNNVLRFCFLGVMMSTLSSVTFAKKIAAALYICSVTAELFLFCSCVQTLLDVSSEVTDNSFEEGWYTSETRVKRTFMLLMMANNVECKLAAVGKYNLSLPSFVAIINQSYSIAVLLSNIN